MLRLGRFLVVASLLWLPVPDGVASDGEFEPSWFLVRLSGPIVDRRPDGSLSLTTGRPAVDQAILESGVHRIEYALEVSALAPGDPEAFRRHGLDRTYRFFAPPGGDIMALVRRFDLLPGVDYAEPDFRAQADATIPDDPLFATDQWSLDQVKAPEGWDVSTGGPVIVAVSDTGVDSDHEDLVGKILPGTDLVNPDDDPEDDGFHGTRVSSIAMANTDNAKGMAGVCWGCLILPVKTFDENRSGTHSRTADGFVWATDHGARVINHSAGSTVGSATLLSGVQYAYDAGVVIVASAGNEDGPVTFPAAYAETVAVGATDDQDRRVKPWSCSGAGGSNFGLELDLVAPGDLILGASMGGGYATRCGTSFAAPIVSGIAGIVETIDPSAGREEVRHLLRSGAEDQVGRVTEDFPGFDPFHGWGRANVERTLLAARSSVSLRVEGRLATRVYLEIVNPLAASFDFIRGDLAMLSETAAGVDAGAVICLEDDSPDADTAGNEDVETPDPGSAFFYLARFTAAPGAGSYGGSSRNRDRAPSGGDCPE